MWLSRSSKREFPCDRTVVYLDCGDGYRNLYIYVMKGHRITHKDFFLNEGMQKL